MYSECCQNVYSKMLISGEGLRYSPAELQFYTSLASLLASLPLSLFLFNWDKVHHCLCISILPSSVPCTCFANLE
jgi:hypothetical protein